MTEQWAGRALDRAHSGAPRRDLYFALLAAVVCLEAVGIGIVFPILAHVQDVHHLATYTLGLMSGASFFAALLAQVTAGPFLDGEKAQRLLLLGVLLGAAGLVWFAFAGGLWELVGARAVGGIGYGIVSPAALRQASVGATGARRGKRLGILSSAQMAGFTLGPFLGSVLYAAGGLRTPFEVVGGLLTLVGLGVLLLPAQTRATTPTGADADAGAPIGGAEAAPAAGDSGVVAPAVAVPGVGVAAPAVTGAAAPAAGGAGVRAETASVGSPTGAAGRRVVGPRWRSLEGLPVGPLIAVLVLGAAMQLPSGLYDSLWSRMLTNRGASALLIGISLSVFGLPFIVLAPLGGRLAERRGPFLAAGLGLVGSDLFMAAYGFVPWPLLIVLLGVGEACVASVAIPGGFAAVGRVFPDDRMATGQGLFGGSGTIAAGSAAVIGAPVFAALGPGAAFAGGAAVSALLVGVAFLVWRSDGLGRRPAVAVASPSGPVPVAGPDGPETAVPAAGTGSDGPPRQPPPAGRQTVDRGPAEASAPGAGRAPGDAGGQRTPGGPRSPGDAGRPGGAKARRRRRWAPGGRRPNRGD